MAFPPKILKNYISIRVPLINIWGTGSIRFGVQKRVLSFSIRDRQARSNNPCRQAVSTLAGTMAGTKAGTYMAPSKHHDSTLERPT